MSKNSKDNTGIMQSKYAHEKDFDQDLQTYLEKRLDLPKHKLEISVKKKIILDTTFYPRGPGKFYFHLDPTECDLVIYKRLLPSQIEKWREVRNRFPEIIEFYRFAENEIVMPIVIIETKNEDMDSHNLLLYSAKADKIKGIFPFVKYLLVCNHTTKLELTLARHGRYFDGVYILHRTQAGARVSTDDLGRLTRDIEECITEFSVDGFS